MLKNLLDKVNLFTRIKAFLDANPQRAKLIGIIAILAIIPLTVAVALTVQNLTQKASVGPTIRITDASGLTITETSSPFVFIALNLPSNWVLPSSSQSNNGLINKAYAASSSCVDSSSGYLGCFSIDAFPSGSICTGFCITAEGQQGQFCYTSAKVGQSCTNESGLLGTCNSQGDCIASAVPPTSTPIPTPTSIPTEIPTVPPSSVTLPQHNTNTDCSGINCSTIPGTTCVYTGIPAWAPYHCEYPNPTSPPTVPTSTQMSVPTIPYSPPTYSPPKKNYTSPTKHVLKQIEVSNVVSQPNENNDGSPLKVINIANENDFSTSFSWKLNTLPSYQNAAQRTVQVTFISNTGVREFAVASVILKRIQTSPSSGSSVFTSGSSVFRFTSGSSIFTSQSQSFNLDLNGDGKVNDDDIQFINSHYGEKGTNSTDLNRDGTVDGLDLNIYLRAQLGR